MAKIAAERPGAIVPESKACKRCNESLPASSFYRHVMMRDGLLSFCKSCTKSRVGLHREQNLDRIREYDRNRPNKSDRMRRSIDRELANPVIRQAHVATKNAIARGQLVRQPCEICGEARVDAHHDDYTKPLCVRWLCRKHHRQHHAATGTSVYRATG